MSISAKRILRGYYVEHCLKKAEPCSIEENKRIANLIAKGNAIEEGVYEYYQNDKGIGEYYRLIDVLTPNETLDYILLKQVKLLTSIKECLVFFVVLTAIGLFAGLLFFVLNRI